MHGRGQSFWEPTKILLFLQFTLFRRIAIFSWPFWNIKEWSTEKGKTKYYIGWQIYSTFLVNMLLEKNPLFCFYSFYIWHYPTIFLESFRYNVLELKKKETEPALSLFSLPCTSLIATCQICVQLRVKSSWNCLYDIPWFFSSETCL